MQPEHVHAVKMDHDFPNFSATVLCEDIEPGKSAFAATKADRAELFWYIWHDLTLALLLNAGCMYLVQSRSHVLDLQCKIKIGFEILIPVVS